MPARNNEAAAQVKHAELFRSAAPKKQTSDSGANNPQRMQQSCLCDKFKTKAARSASDDVDEVLVGHSHGALLEETVREGAVLEIQAIIKL